MSPSDAPPLVYVVDDDADVRMALTLLIETCGWRVRAFASADAFLQRSAGDDDAQACLLLDLQLPGMNGAELQEHLSDQGLGIPTVVLTANPDSALAARAVAAGALLVMAKPPDPAHLKTALAMALEQAAA